MKKVSVIIPVFNTEEFIDVCIESVLKQTYKNIEIILINDGSNESCTKHVESLAEDHKTIKLLHIEKKVGVGAARNLGMKEASGDYLYFLDSDDYIPSESLSLLVDHIGEFEMITGLVSSTYLSSSFHLLFKGLFKPKVCTTNRFDLLRDNSVHNFLIRKDFVVAENLLFSEDVSIYSDLSFMIPALIKSERIPYLEEAVYFERVRNDPVSNPALSQYDKQFVVTQFLRAYIALKETVTNELANEALDRNLLNFYRKDMITHFLKNENIDDIYPKLLRAVRLANPKVIEQYDWVLKREIKAILSGKEKKFKRITARHHLLRDIRDSMKKNRKLFLYRRIFMKLPMKKNVIFFESFLGKNYSDSPKYIYEYMLKNNKDFTFVWSFNEKKNIPGNAIQVERFSFRYFYYLARAKYWVSNSRLPKYLDKREGNVYLQTWHGTPLKKLVFDMQDIYSADPKYKSNFYEQSRRWDYLSSPNAYSSEIFKSAFKYDKKMLEFGYPRNDILYEKNNDADITKLKNKMNIPQDKKVVLYAPTWRDDDYFARGQYNFELQLNLKEMQEKLGHEYIVILRLHYFIANKIDVKQYEGFVYDLSTYDDIAELYLVSDMLITDYSSVFFDFANLKRPIMFYMYDLEKYRDQLRGFYLNIEEEVPGPILMNTDEIITSIENIDQVTEKYNERYDIFYERFCKWDDGNAAEKTVKTVFEQKDI